VQPELLEDSLGNVRAILGIVERDRTYRNRVPCGEPQLGRRGLYRHFGGETGDTLRKAVLWTLSGCDGEASLLDIAERARMRFEDVAAAADLLVRHEMLEELA
jgi:aminopeptidase-like protein